MRNFFKYFIAFCLFIVTFVSYSVYCNASTTSYPRISSKNMKYSSDYINVDIKIPILSYKNNLNAEERINTLLEGDIISFKNQIENLAKESFKESKNDNFKFIPYETIEDYKVTFNNGKLLSLPITFYTYTGGAHGNTIKEAYNFNLENGDRLTLKDIFLNDSNYKDTLKQFIKTSIEENPDIYFDYALDVVDNLDDSISFYITDSSLVIYYGSYEIAPYSSGIREFEIPLFSLSSKLNPKYSLVQSK